MTDDSRVYRSQPQPAPERPLQGMTVLVVEDSRFASEAIRLLCLRSGARVRRADSLAATYRHLAVYRPGVAIVDMGLPDGSGADLIAALAGAQPRLPVLIGMSGDAGAEAAALRAGADGFLAKPIDSVALFQQAVLRHLPAGCGPRAVSTEQVAPDPVALADDLEHIAMLMRRDVGSDLDYAAQFLGGVARSAHDTALEAVAESLRDTVRGGAALHTDVARLAGIVEARLAAVRAV
jgi:CheY-like chemotaxis protein